MAEHRTSTEGASVAPEQALGDRFDSWQAIDASDAEIEAALAEANIPALMAALVHITGDPGHVRGEIRPANDFFGDAQGNIDEASQARVRAVALEALKALRDRGGELPPAPSTALVREMMDFLTGAPLPDEYGEFLQSELALDGADPYLQPGLFDVPEARRAAFRVVIVGAGMSGLLAGHRLSQAGIDFTIIEKNEDVGGTWFENTYPGCRVDSPNHTYSYSFAPKDWPNHFSPQPALLEYFQDCAEKMGLRERIRFGHEVVRSVYDEDAAHWRVTIRDGQGTETALEADAVISATGQLNRPRMPDLAGRDDFTGPSWHSARWRDDVDLTGLRVGVIGTGASAFQFVPRIVDAAAHVTVFQRTPPWVSPREEYQQPIPAGKHWLLNHVPFYAKWFRLLTFWRTSEGILSMVRREPDYDDREDAVGEANEALRAMLVEYMRETLGDREDLLALCTPAYPPAGKRMLVDDGTWLRTLTRDDVTLTDDPIDRITATGLVTASGAEHEFDVIIYGTGFHASRIAWPQDFVGRGGRSLQEQWDGDPQAHLGITVAGFPNLFLMYGPNTNIVVNGSIVFFSECEMRYILGCIELLLKEDAGALEPKQAVQDDFVAEVDEGNARRAGGAPGVRSWYKNARGRVTQNWPFTLPEYWQRTRAPDARDFELSGSGGQRPA